MARPLRVEFPGAAYHVMARGNENRPICRDDTDYQLFLATLEEMILQFDVHILVFCLLPSQYHLAIRTPRANLSRAIGWLQTTYTIRFNRRHRRRGHLFQGRFQAHLVEEDAHALALMRYLHLNPVRLRAIKAATASRQRTLLAAYPWSSHRSHAGLDTPPDWLRPDWLRYYAHTPAKAHTAYRRDIDQALQTLDDTTPPWRNLPGGLVLGGKTLRKKAAALLRKKESGKEIPWAHSSKDHRIHWRQKIKAEPDPRWKIWLRVRALGERKVDIAQSLGYRDGSAILQILKRLETRAAHDATLAKKKTAYEKALSTVKP